MQTNELITELGSTITALMAHGKGHLAADESNSTIGARFLVGHLNMKSIIIAMTPAPIRTAGAMPDPVT